VDSVDSQNCTFKEHILVSFWIRLNLLFNGATLYGCSNIIMSTYTTIGDGLHVYVCNACFKFYEQPQWIKYVVFQNINYMKQILVNNLLHVQLLSLIDISMKTEQRNYIFMHG
jgi:hypothetical protein